jgi:small subunit ribosomal protein S1
MSNKSLTPDFPPESMEDFAKLLEEDPISSASIAGSVVTGIVTAIQNDLAIVDVGLKSEGRVPLRDFSPSGQNSEVKIGDEIEVYIERMENRDGLIDLSISKARREAAWVVLEKAFQNDERVKGVIFGRVKGGLTVDLSGAMAFLPSSQVDIRPIRDVESLMNIEQPFVILKMDRARGNIVVSRRAILEESRAKERGELMENLQEGQVLEGIVKNITDYGAFVDLGGVDGLLHVTDISWKRINHPSEVLSVGQKINVQVIRYNADSQRISLGMKQLEEDPWKDVEAKYPIGAHLEGTVTNLTDYGAFIELQEGVEGLAHVSDMSWTRKGLHPSHFVSLGQKINVKILSIDSEKRRIALGVKQCIDNPWEKLREQFEIGSEVEGEIKNITEFGLFVGLTDEIDGMVHMSDLSWSKPGDEAIKEYTKNETVKVKVLDIDPEKERVVLGIKQLGADPFASGLENIKKNSVVTCEIIDVQDAGVEVKVGEITGFIRKAELSKDRAERRSDRFAVGEKVDAKVTAIDAKSRKLNLSIRAREIDEEKDAMAAYGSTDSGASLGDILGAAMKAAKSEGAAEKKAPAKKKAAPKKKDTAGEEKEDA